MEDLQRQALRGEGCTKECHAQSVMRAVAMAIKQQPRRRLCTKTAPEQELPPKRERLPKRKNRSEVHPRGRRPRKDGRRAASLRRLKGWKRSAKMMVTCEVCGREVRKDVLSRHRSTGVCKRHAA